MVLRSYIEEQQIGTSTLSSNKILMHEELICSSDESVNTQSSSLESFIDNSKEKTDVRESKMDVETFADDESMSAVSSSHGGDLATTENGCIKFFSLSNDDDNVPKDIEILKNKLYRVLKKRDQYKRRVESLTNGIIALRGTKLVLERKIIGAKLSWDIKQNKKFKL